MFKLCRNFMGMLQQALVFISFVCCFMLIHNMNILGGVSSGLNLIAGEMLLMTHMNFPACHRDTVYAVVLVG